MGYQIISIGISNYKKSSINSLRCPSTDAKSFLNSAELGFSEQISYKKLLCNNEATLIDIKEALTANELKNADREDTLIVYYSGHGTHDDREVYIANYDIDPQRLDVSGVSISYLKEQIESLNHKVKILILDCCHSGGVNSKSIPSMVEAKGATNLKSFLNQKFADGIFVFTACKDDESAYEVADMDNSLFTHYLLEELTKSKEAFISISDIISPVTNSVEQHANRNKVKQTPTAVLKQSGDIKVPKFGHYKKPNLNVQEDFQTNEHESRKIAIPPIDPKNKEYATAIKETFILIDSKKERCEITTKSYISRSITNLKEKYLQLPKNADNYDDIAKAIETIEADALKLFILASCVTLASSHQTQRFFAKQASSILNWKNGQSGTIAMLDISDLLLLLIIYIQMVCSIYNEDFTSIEELLSQEYSSNYETFQPIYENRSIHHLHCLSGTAPDTFSHVIDFLKKQVWLQDLLGIDEKSIESLTLQANLLICILVGHHTTNVLYPSYYKYDIYPLRQFLHMISSSKDVSDNISALLKSNKTVAQVFTEQINELNKVAGWMIFDKLNPSNYFKT